MPGAPHFAYPFEFAGGRVRTVPQDSPEDVIGVCCRTILLYPLGSRPLVPEFGVEDQAFEQGGPDLDELRAAITANESRADVDVEVNDDALRELAAGVARARLSVSVTQGA